MRVFHKVIIPSLSGSGFGGPSPVFETAFAAAPRPPSQTASFGGSADFSPDREDAAIDSTDGGATLDSPRTDFPETWLWDIVVVP